MGCGSSRLVSSPPPHPRARKATQRRLIHLLALGRLPGGWRLPPSPTPSDTHSHSTTHPRPELTAPPILPMLCKQASVVPAELVAPATGVARPSKPLSFGRPRSVLLCKKTIT